MEKETIAVKVRVEGSYPPGEMVVELPQNATLLALLNYLGRSKHPFSAYLFDAKTSESAVSLALVNDRSLLQQDFEKLTLSDADRVIFILLISGG